MSSWAQKKPHVPKFGDWDSNDNIQITACFENARKEKDGSVIKRNPNDPEDNPEAFKGMLGLESSAPRPQHPYHATAAGSSTNINKPSTEKAADRRNNLMNQRSKVSGGGNRPKNTTSSDSERSNSDYALMGRHRRERSDRRKSGLASSVGSDHSISHQSQSGRGHNSMNSSRPRSTSATTHHSSNTDTHNRAASIPKFGDWDEKDPQSGEGYTIIFNKVKEEKDTASSNKFPPPTPNKNWDTTANKHGKSSSKSSKICCCLSPSARE